MVDLKVDLTDRVGLNQPFVLAREVDLSEINIPTLISLSHLPPLKKNVRRKDEKKRKSISKGGGGMSPAVQSTR